MGIKGDKLTNDSNDAAQYLLDQCQNIAGLSAKKMFGGNGLFHDKKMFGLVNSKGQIFVKANKERATEYVLMGSIKHVKMPYFLVPDKILQDNDALNQWVDHAIEVSKK